MVLGQSAPGPSRLGLVVSRKVSNAIARNHVKRRVREIFRTADVVPSGIDLIVIAGPGAAELSLEQMRAEWSGVQEALVKKCTRALAEPPRPTHVGRRRDR